jgi:TatD DNase family protein
MGVGMNGMVMPEVIDSHAHLTSERLAADAASIVGRAREAGVQAVITIGSGIADSEAAIRLAATLPDTYAVVGIHPHTADQANPAAFRRLRELAVEPGVVGIGETGLDFHYDYSPRDAQRSAFLEQIGIGRELDLPIVVHSRSADLEVAGILLKEGRGTRGVLHCFSGGADLLAAALDIGWYVSFAGMITFSRYADADLLRAVPLDRLLVETDSPYLAPVPHRGRRNEPAHVVHVARKAAEIRGDDVAELAAATAANTRALFRLEEARP